MNATNTTCPSWWSDSRNVYLFISYTSGLISYILELFTAEFKCSGKYSSMLQLLQCEHCMFTFMYIHIHVYIEVTLPARNSGTAP